MEAPRRRYGTELGGERCSEDLKKAGLSEDQARKAQQEIQGHIDRLREDPSALPQVTRDVANQPDVRGAAGRAAEGIEGQPFDLILLDVMMPGPRGTGCWRRGQRPDGARPEGGGQGPGGPPPRGTPGGPGLEFAWTSRPGDEPAGDVLGAARHDARRAGLSVLDMSDHGVASSLPSVSIARVPTPPDGPTSTLGTRDEAGQSRPTSSAEVRRPGILFPAANGGGSSPWPGPRAGPAEVDPVEDGVQPLGRRQLRPAQRVASDGPGLDLGPLRGRRRRPLTDRRGDSGPLRFGGTVPNPNFGT